MFVLVPGRTGSQKPGFLPKSFVVVHSKAKKPGFFGLMGKFLRSSFIRGWQINMMR
ncbi:MAG: hypothetical protein JGK33_21670 [Microcoleus sp. PH2017_11_PCY_U_A]|uniref:hypothetical protein n=1 Tax=Microcoleus sp. PH2017_22_RUC_O_B TaxID=2798833 RepID=UPI001DFF7CBC|nr:hypothetical protein [Microcoleus sp. PH2017_22_RUC_O_B]MCC3462223.1 hypothetical protein [Microcoleus sp. PH2017_11_PCY_U_A]